MEFVELELAPGKTFKFAPLTMTDENVEFLAGISDMGRKSATADSETPVNVDMGGLLRACARALKESLSENHTPEEVAAAQRLVPISFQKDSVFEKILQALMGI